MQLTKDHLRLALLSVDQRTAQTANEARMKADLLRYFADILDPPKQPETPANDLE